MGTSGYAKHSILGGKVHSGADAPAANSNETAVVQARGRPFQKGQSGNPRGRPKRDHSIAELARAHTDAAIATLVEIMSSENSPPNARVQAAGALLDRGYGRPPQSLDVEHRVSLAQEFEAFIRELNGLEPARN